MICYLLHSEFFKKGNLYFHQFFTNSQLQDTATYSNSNSITEGIDSVYVNGVLVYKDKQFTGAAPGKMLRHNA